MGPENLDFLKMYPVFRIHFWAQNASCKPSIYTEKERIVMAENQAQNPQTEKVITLSASLLEPFQGHPFRVASGEEMEQLKESIREYGVLSPLLVRPRGDGRYEIVSGHRRKAACEALGITELPVLVRNKLSDHVEWLRQLDEDAESLLNGCDSLTEAPTKQQQVEEELPRLLEKGPVSNQEIIQHFKNKGIQDRTVNLVKGRLNIRSVRKGDKWYWQLNA